MRWIAVLLGVLVFAPASAETLYRCKDKRGAVSLQSEPCPKASSQSAKVFGSYVDNPDAAAQSRARQREMDQRNARAHGPVYSYSRGPTESQQRASACQEAKNHRDYMLKVAGMRRTFDLLRQLDDQVHRACK